MNDPSRFTSIQEYYYFIYAISYMMLAELCIWIYNFKGWLKKQDHYTHLNNSYYQTPMWFCDRMGVCCNSPLLGRKGVS